MTSRITRRVLLGTAGAALAAPALRAQEAWPARPVRIVVPYAPGGGTDITNRAVAEALTQRFGRNFLVENRAGANGIIGAEAIARARPDGYNFVAPNGTHAMLRHITPQLPFDPIADFTPVAMLASYCFVLVANVNAPFRDIPSLIAHAKARPGQVAHGTADVASGYTAAQFVRAAGIEMNEVRYAGTGAAVGDLTGGHLPLSWVSTASAMALLPGGMIRLLAVTQPTRSAFLPDVPSLAELGLGAANFVGWFGLFGPARLPPEITERYNAAIQEAVQTPAVQQRYRSLAVDPYPVSPAQMAAIVAEDDQRWAAAVREGTLRAS
jgi:tripartite-type tricarboxylate transporter receptor subunit TctC